MTAATWQDVAEVLLKRWPAGPGNKGWEHEQLAGYVAELQEDKLTPHWAIMGLRESTSDFVPSVGRVRAMATEVKGPPTTAELIEAEERHRLQMAERAAAREAKSLPAG